MFSLLQSLSINLNVHNYRGFVFLSYVLFFSNLDLGVYYITIPLHPVTGLLPLS